LTLPLDGRLVLVTGASRGIGAAIASRIAALGAVVVRVARSEMPTLPRALDYRCDLADPIQRAEVLHRIRQECGLPWAVVNNAGAFLLAPIEQTSDELLREQVVINLEVPFAIARAFLPEMRERGIGRHVLIGSVADHRAFPENSAYSASKFAARGMHEVLLEEFRGTGVNCTLVSPGPTDTTAWDPFDPDARAGFTPRASMLHPADIADAVAWVLTRPARITVDWVRLGPA